MRAEGRELLWGDNSQTDAEALKKKLDPVSVFLQQNPQTRWSDWSLVCLEAGVYNHVKYEMSDASEGSQF